MALGAGRWRLVRESLAESILLAFLGGAAGVLVTFWGIKLFVALAPNFYGSPETFRIDVKVLGFVSGVSLLAGILAGLVPALRVSTTGLTAALKERSLGWTGRRRRQVGAGAFVVFEVAIAVVLLVGAGLMINSVVRLTTVDMGFDPDGLAKMSIRVQGSAYQLTEPNILPVTPQVASFYQRLIDRLESQPGVDSVGLVSGLPGGRFSAAPFEIVGRTASPEERQQQWTQFKEINDDFFVTMGIPLLRGRSFSELDDGAAPPVAVINDTMVRQFFAEEDPIGRFIHVDLTAGITHPELAGDKPREIVGVVGSIKHGRRMDLGPEIYVPFHQHLTVYPDTGPWAVHLIKDIAIRTSSDPAGLLGPMQRAIAEVDRTQVAYRVMTMEEQLAEMAPVLRFWMRFLMLWGGVAIVLAALGLYAVIAQSVTQRTHELGVPHGARSAERQCTAAGPASGFGPRPTRGRCRPARRNRPHPVAFLLAVRRYAYRPCNIYCRRARLDRRRSVGLLRSGSQGDEHRRGHRAAPGVRRQRATRPALCRRGEARAELVFALNQAMKRPHRR